MGAGGRARVPGYHCPLRRGLGRHQPGHLRIEPLPPLRDHPGDAGLDRPQPAGQRGGQPHGHLPGPAHHGRLPGRPDDLDPSASTTATSRATRRRRHRLGARRRRGHGQARRCSSRRSAPRSPSGWRGTSATISHEPQCSGRRRTCGPGRSPALGRPGGRALRRLHLQLPVVDRGASGSAGSARRRTSSTAATSPARAASSPLNTHGGQLSAGRTHGMGLVHEAVVQLRGEGGRPPGARRLGGGREQRRVDPLGGDPSAPPDPNRAGAREGPEE